MSLRSVTVIVPEAVTRDEVEAARDVCGWLLANVVQGDAARPFQLMYVAPDGRTQLHYVDDARVGVKSVRVRGVDADAMAQAVRDRLGHYTMDEIARKLDARERTERVRGWHQAMLALTPPEVNATWLERLRRALGDPEPTVREVALLAVARWSTAGVREAVRKVARGDRERSLRQRAEETLARLGDG